MVDMKFDIVIGKFKLNSLISCEVRKSAGKLSDTATIVLPGMAYNKSLEIEDKIKRSDKVIIKLGYNDNLVEEIEGFVTSIATADLITIELEDGMFNFRKDIKNFQYVNKTVGDIIADINSQIGGYKLIIGEGVSDIRYDKFTIQDATAFEVFEKIRQETSLHIFIKKKELHVHLKSTYKSGNVKFNFSRNVEESNLKYVSIEDKKVEVEVVGINRKNEKTIVKVGDSGGDKITVHRYNVSDEKALKTIGEEELKKYRFTGYEGDITTWLFPFCTYGYTASIMDEDYPLRDGNYYVEAVTTTFDESGGKRKVMLGLKLK
jgi:hypothetical protein